MRVQQSVVRAALLVAFGWVAVFAAGCSGKENRTGEVHGKVTYNGKAVTAGVVKFFPESGGEPVEASIGPEGSYRATGVPVGRSKVAIETLRFKQLTPPPAGIAKQLGGPQTKYVPIPEKYEKSTSSELTFDVIEGVMEWPIELK